MVKNYGGLYFDAPKWKKKSMSKPYQINLFKLFNKTCFEKEHLDIGNLEKLLEIRRKQLFKIFYSRTFYNLNTTTDITKTIIKSLIDKFHVPAKELIQKIYKDTRFRSRYVVTFYNQTQYDTLLNDGIKINGTSIRAARLITMVISSK